MTGLVVGKFYPPHNGHSYLIETARAQVDHLYVFLCHHPSQTIPGALRYQWLNELHPDCHIRLIDDELREDSWEWATFVKEYLGFAPDVIFSSESYGEPFAHHLGARSVCVDIDRTLHPVSGSQVRQAPLKHWEFLSKPVRAYFAKRVVLPSHFNRFVAETLASHFKTVLVPRVEGEFDPSTLAVFQKAREDRLARECNKILICEANCQVDVDLYLEEDDTVESAIAKIEQLILTTDTSVQLA